MKIYKQLLVTAGLLALAASPALAYEPGTFILRGGVGTVAPKSNNLSGQIEDEFATFEASVDVANGTGMTLSGTYMINENWAFDVLAALPIRHDIDFTIFDYEVPDVLAVQDVKGKLGDTKQIPPTVSFQYHFAPDRDFQPYFGLGLNWTTFSSTSFEPKVEGVPLDDLDVLLGIEKMHLDDSFGLAAQLGGDWAIGDRAVVSFDVRWMDIDPELLFSGPSFDGREKAGTIEIDPWIYSLNLGYRF